MLETGMAMGIVATEELLWGADGDDDCSIAAATDVSAGKATRCLWRPLSIEGGCEGRGGGGGGGSAVDLHVRFLNELISQIVVDFISFGGHSASNITLPLRYKTWDMIIALPSIPVVLWVLVRRPRHVHVVGEDGERGHREEGVGRVRHPLSLGRGCAAHAGRRQRRSGRRRRGRRTGEVEGDLDLVVVELLLMLVVLLAERVGQTERRRREAWMGEANSLTLDVVLYTY